MCENKQEKGATPVVWGCSDQDGRQCRPLGRLQAFETVFAGSQPRRLLARFLLVYDHLIPLKRRNYGILTGVAKSKGGNMNNNQKNKVRIPSGKEYDAKTAINIRRRQEIKFKDKKLVTISRYEIRDMQYKVNSIFDLENLRDSEEGLKRLMVSDANKAS